MPDHSSKGVFAEKIGKSLAIRMHVHALDLGAPFKTADRCDLIQCLEAVRLLQESVNKDNQGAIREFIKLCKS